MNNKWYKIILQGVAFILFQLLFANYINLWGLINPKFYIIYLILFPKYLKPFYLMTLGLIIGFISDVYSGTHGVGMSSSVILAFVLPYLFSVLTNKNFHDEVEFSSKMKDQAFLYRYVFFGLLIFHLAYFIIQMGEFYNISYIILKAILSSLIAFFIYVLYRLTFTDNIEKSKKVFQRVK